ncbi:MAG: Hsp20/alpha crystallin family protein [Solirubrobacteraceae bacterium]
MALVRWEPLRELNTLQHEMNRLFGGFFEQPAGQPGGLAPARQWVPAMDLVETDGAYILRADLPGLTRDDVKIELEQNVLTISGERAAKHEQRTDGYYRIERASGSFARSLTLPSGIDADRIEATFADGVLEVRIPTPQQPRPRRVEITTPDGTPAPTVEGTEAAVEQAAPAADASPDLVGATA